MAIFKRLTFLITSVILSIVVSQTMAAAPIPGYPFIQVTVYNKTSMPLTLSAIQASGGAQLYYVKPGTNLEPSYGFAYIQFQPTAATMKSYGITFSLYNYYTDSTGQKKQAGCSYMVTCTAAVFNSSTAMYYCPTENIIVSATMLAPGIPVQPVCINGLTKSVGSVESGVIPTIVNFNISS